MLHLVYETKPNVKLICSRIADYYATLTPPGIFIAMPTISAVLIVKNESSVIDACLSALKPVVDEIIVADTGSGDDTIARAKITRNTCSLSIGMTISPGPVMRP